MCNKKPLLNWTSHPLRDYPKNSVILILFILIIAVSLWKIAVVEWQMPIFYILGLIIFVLSFSVYFIPTEYSFFEDKIVIIYWFYKVEKKYSDFGCFYADKKGVMLSTFKMPRRLDAFRGLNIRFSHSKEEKEKLFAILKEKIGNRF